MVKHPVILANTDHYVPEAEINTLDIITYWTII